MLCRHVAAADGLNVCTLRLYSAYGPWEEPKRLIPALAVEGLHGRFPPLVDPQTARDFVWVGDIVDAYLLAARAVHAEPGAVYNVGTGTQTTVGEAAEIARERARRRGEPRLGIMAARSWDTDCWVADSSKIRRTLSWRPTRGFREGFEELASWFRAKPDAPLLLRHRPGMTVARGCASPAPGTLITFEQGGRPCPVCGSTDARVFVEARFEQSELDSMSFSSRKVPEGLYHRLLECARATSSTRAPSRPSSP